MQKRYYINSESDELLHVFPARDYLLKTISVDHTPFKRKNTQIKIWRRLISLTIRFAEKQIGQKLYVENQLRELIALEPEIRTLILKLIKKKIVSSWTTNVISGYEQYITCVRIELGEMISPKGNKLKLKGSNGVGVGGDINEAMLPALAELLERHSTIMWKPERIIIGSYTLLKKMGAVDPLLFRYFTKKQLQSGQWGEKFKIDHKQILGWVRGISLLSGRPALLPAQMTYIFYDDDNPEEPTFFQTSTSGVAASTSYRDAAQKAIYELIERDAFLLFWLNKISPPQIDKDTIKTPEIKELIQHLHNQNFEVYILDITSDFKIPTCTVVIRSQNTETFVAVGAAAGFSVVNVVKKAILEAARIVQFHSKISNELYFQAKNKYPHISSFGERFALWTNKEHHKEIDFFLNGTSESFLDFEKKSSNISGGSFNNLVSILKELKRDCYLVDITSEEALEAGLIVVRAIMPDAIPIYFREQYKPLGHKRIIMAPKEIGYHNTPANEDEINKVPHPFL